MMDKQRHLVGIEYEVVLECQLRKLGTFVCVFVCVWLFHFSHSLTNEIPNYTHDIQHVSSLSLIVSFFF